jgi:hypothetical protein
MRPALTVGEIGALPDLDNIAIRITHVATDLAVFGDRRSDKLGPPAAPQFVASLNIRNTDVHKAVDPVGVGGAQRYRRFVGRRSASDVDKQPCIRDLNVARRPAAVASAQNATAENLFVPFGRSVDVGDGEEVRDCDPHFGRHLIARLVDLYRVH